MDNKEALSTIKIVVDNYFDGFTKRNGIYKEYAETAIQALSNQWVSEVIKELNNEILSFAPTESMEDKYFKMGLKRALHRIEDHLPPNSKD